MIKKQSAKSPRKKSSMREDDTEENSMSYTSDIKPARDDDDEELALGYEREDLDESGIDEDYR
jgi:hypothetical protein